MGHRLLTTLSLPLLALGVPLAGCRDADAPVTPPISGPRFSHVPGQALEGRIAFHSNRGGDGDIYVMNPDGSNVTNVTNTIDQEFDPIWSPDGRQIAFGKCAGGCEIFFSEVWVINADGSGLRQLTDGGGFPGAWSPDGARIAFVSARDGDDEVFIMNADGSDVTQVTHNDVIRDFPTAWSPNGQQILFQSDRDGNTELYVMNVDGSELARLTDNPASDEGDRAGWSPDGQRIVFSSRRDGGDLDIFVINADGSGVVQLTQNDGIEDDDPVWSPDGEHIAFHSTRDGDEEIYVMDAGGTFVTQLTFNEGPNDAVPVWIQPGPPSNDDFASARVTTELPFSNTVDITGATREAGEPAPSCVGGSHSGHSVWYSFTPTTAAVLSPSLDRFYSVVAAYTGASLETLSEIWCRSPYVVKPWFVAQAGTTYYFQVDGLFAEAGSLTFSLEEIPPPPNDDFASATVISGLPFSDIINNAAATTESGEPTSICSFGAAIRTAWYAFTPPQTGSISASVVSAAFVPVVAAYTGNTLSGLTEVHCRQFFAPLTFRAEAGTTYYLQVGSFYSDQGGPAEFQLVVTPQPVASFSFNPSEPSVFDGVQFVDNSSDPGGLGFESHQWDFGDGAGTTIVECCVTHQYAADGSYSVQLIVTTLDGRTASTSQTVLVRTHDVAITKFLVPQVASAGQTRRIVVGISNVRYDETVEVQLFKSAPEGFQLVASQTQSVPVRPANRTTDFGFSHTFTDDEARLGKITFKAVAVVVTARDALAADNEAIAAPTKVNR